MIENNLNPYMIRKSMESIDLSKQVKINTDVSIDEDLIFKDDHDAMPLKKQSDLLAISNYFLANKQYRNNLLFTMGIHFGLRSSDLRRLKFYHLIDKDGHLRKGFDLLEQKTSATRKRKVNRILGINSTVAQAIVLYLENSNEEISLNDFVFRSESRNKPEGESMSRQGIEDIIKGVTKKLSIEGRYSTHTFRKTFGYHYYMQTGNIVLLQKMFGHSSPLQTLTYIGITRDEILSAYENLHLLDFGKINAPGEKDDATKSNVKLA